MFNNNESFNNNPKPLFENEFNNVNVSTQPNFSGFQNSSQSSDVNTFNNEFNVPNSINTNDFSQTVNFTNTLSQDLPPELGAIKNLNEATKVDAPTMDVLGPMNVMPEEPLFSNDPITAYEKGNVNLNNDINTVPIASTPIDALNYDIHSEINQATNNLYTNDNFLNNFNSADPSFNQEINPVSMTNINNEFSADLPNIKEEDELKDNYTIVQDVLEKELSPEYDIVDKPLTIENREEKKEVNKEVLDIMDYEEDEEETLKASEEPQELVKPEIETNEKPLLIEQVKKIEKLVNEMKSIGIDVKLEQYDFEHMYQLIIKINK